MRPSGRLPDELRDISIEPHVSRYAEGSCLVRFGNTHVYCTASLSDTIPNFLRGKGKGWVTAEYAMLPRSTHSRMRRESTQGKQSGRTLEIQRLISRSLRSVVDLEQLGERQIIVDCDVIQADGGTRTASITGAYVAMALACKELSRRRMISRNPILTEVAAVSCGIYEDVAVLDLDYDEDSEACVDANFVMTGHGSIVEIQGTGEERPFSESELTSMMGLAKDGVETLIALQRKVLQGGK